MDSTIRFYDEHASEFRERTLCVPMEHLYAQFLAHVPPGGRILDAGCGVGRDSRAFLDRGYDVLSFDASESMVAFTTELTGRPALRLRFEDVLFRDEFDGVWACASLLHVPRTGIEPVLSRLLRALRAGGVLYASFKVGRGERRKDGRLFSDYDEETFRALAASLPQTGCIDCWQTEDPRCGLESESWLNAILRRMPGR